MRIIHLGTYDCVGGAARAMSRLHEALRVEGEDSRLLVRTRRGNIPACSEARPEPRVTGKIRRRWRAARANRQKATILSGRPADQDGFHGDLAPFGAELAAQLRGADVVHVHWVNDYVHLPSFLPAVTAEIPVVWTLHDLNGLTGGCHYSRGCDRWKTGCDRCPQFTLRPDHTLPARVWERLNTSVGRIPDGRLHVVGASRWMAGMAHASPRFAGRPVHCIPLGLDTSVFTPRDRRFAREMLGLPEAAHIVLFVSDTTGNSRKGLDVLFRAIRRIDVLPGLLLASVGQGGADHALGLGLNHRHLGSFNEERWLSLVYSAADVFVIPSLEEAYGQTMLEALACGVPVIGSDTGGIPDLVTHGETGLLFPPGNDAALADAIGRLLADSTYARKLGENGRRRVEAHHSPAAYAGTHRALYQSLLAGVPPRDG